MLVQMPIQRVPRYELLLKVHPIADPTRCAKPFRSPPMCAMCRHLALLQLALPRRAGCVCLPMQLSTKLHGQLEVRSAAQDCTVAVHCSCYHSEAPGCLPAQTAPSAELPQCAVPAAARAGARETDRKSGPSARGHQAQRGCAREDEGGGRAHQCGDPQRGRAVEGKRQSQTALALPQCIACGKLCEAASMPATPVAGRSILACLFICGVMQLIELDKLWSGVQVPCRAHARMLAHSTLRACLRRRALSRDITCNVVGPRGAACTA